MLAGIVVHPFDDAETVLRAYREFAADAPDGAAAWFVIRHAPPLPVVPEEWHGEKVLVLAAFYAGDADEGEAVLRPLRDVGDPIVDAVGPHTYVDWQRAFDPPLGEGVRNYWKSHNFVEMTDGMANFVEYGERCRRRSRR